LPRERTKSLATCREPKEAKGCIARSSREMAVERAVQHRTAPGICLLETIDRSRGRELAFLRRVMLAHREWQPPQI
jgi:hypothetical protein